MRAKSLQGVGTLLLVGALAGTASGQGPQVPLAPRGSSLTPNVTLSARGETLQEWARRLGASGGSRLRAGKGVEWERVSLFIRERRQREVMAHLAALLDYRWERQPGGKSDLHVLIPSATVRQRERELRLATLDRSTAPLLRMTRFLAQPAAYFAQLEDRYHATREQPEDPLLHFPNITYLARPAPRMALELLTTLSPEQRLALFAEERFLLRWSEMSPRQQELVLVLAEEEGRMRQRFNPRKGEKVEDSVDWAKRFGVVLGAEQHPVTGTIRSYTWSFGGGYAYAAVPGRAALRPEVLPVRGNPYGRRRSAEPPVYPSLEGKPFPAAAWNASRPLAWSEALEKLSGRLDYPLYSDDYQSSPSPRERGGDPLPDLTRLELPAALDALCRHYGYLWWYQDGALFFRSRTWFLERQYLVPPATVALLQGQLKAHGRLDTRGVDALSKLTSHQLISLNALAALDDSTLKLSAASPRLYGIRMGRREARAAHGYLQVYSTLIEPQKRQVLSPGGLPAANLNQEQRERFLEFLAVEYGRDVLAAPGGLRLQAQQRVTRDTAGPRATADLLFTCSDPERGHAPIKERLSFRLPLEP